MSSIFVMRQVCSNLPLEVSVTMISMPETILWIVSVRPRLSWQVIILSLFLIMSVMLASERDITSNVRRFMLNGLSLLNQAKPLICPLRGAPSGMRNLSEPSSSPSRFSQFPLSHDVQSSHSSFER